MTAKDRQTAARYLRLARASSGEAAAEAVAWARCARPKSLPALRMEVRILLQQGDLESADTLIAQGILIKPDDTALNVMLVERLLERGNLDRAQQVIINAVKRRPNHRATRIVAGKIAMSLECMEDAIEHFIYAINLRPGNSNNGWALLFEAFLVTGDMVHAESALAGMNPSSPLLQARFLRASRQPLEAADTLEDAIINSTVDDREALFNELISTLEELSDFDRLHSLIENIPTGANTVLISAGMALLSMGEFAKSIDVVSIVKGAGSVIARKAQAITAIAENSQGYSSEAVETMSNMNERGEGVEDSFLAEIWRRAAMGNIVTDICGGAPIGADSNVSPLARLVEASLPVFEMATSNDPEAAADARACRNALGLGNFKSPKRNHKRLRHQRAI